MFAFIPVIYPLGPVLLGAGADAFTVAACSKSGGGKKKAQTAALKARTEALQQKP
ncbi:MAG TPA: hypothetical protein VGG37_07015 [Opitutaceae bacterium]|jgi:hypothetical protein